MRTSKNLLLISMVLIANLLSLSGVSSFAADACSDVFGQPHVYFTSQNWQSVSVEKGDKIIFSDNSIITLGDLLGAGKNTRIFAIKGNRDKVLGLPFNGLPQRPDVEAIRNYASYSRTSKLARQAGYPIIETREKDGLIFRRRLKPFYSLDKFLMSVPLISDENGLNTVQRKMLNSFFDLVESLKGLKSEITDIGRNQVAWDNINAKWVYVDFADFRESSVLQNGFSQANNDFAFLNLVCLERFQRAKNLISRYFAGQDPLEVAFRGVWF